MRVQPHLPSSPLTATVIESDGSALCACSAAKSPAPPEPRIRMSVESSRKLFRFHAEARERLLAARLRDALDLRVEARSVAVHGDDQWPEATHAELPQRLGMQVIEIDILDRLDPRGLERRGAADDGEV